MDMQRIFNGESMVMRQNLAHGGDKMRWQVTLLETRRPVLDGANPACMPPFVYTRSLCLASRYVRQ
jgi:hypothetical protein